MSTLKVLCIGDVVGASGRLILKNKLPALRDEFQADMVIANTENAAHGFGLTPSTAREMFESGVDLMTGGNHSFDKRDVLEAFDLFRGRLLRPANYPPETAGEGSALFELPGGLKLGVINLMGRVFMDPLDCPFSAADRLIRKLREETPLMILDFHGEATSEKAAMGFHCDGRVSAVVGTHTHVQTADEMILENGTGFITDLGMTGPIDSVIGMKKEAILSRFRERRPVRMEVADGPAVLQGIFLELDPSSGRCLNIRRIRRLDESFQGKAFEA